MCSTDVAPDLNDYFPVEEGKVGEVDIEYGYYLK